MKNAIKKAVVLLSGGMDSATVLSIAQKQGFACCALSFDYQQRHLTELNAARVLAKALKVLEHKIIQINMRELGGSALTDDNIAVPTTTQTGIPPTYVPARNTIFLSFALAYAEVVGSQDIFIGVNAVDYSGYPDCRAEYIAAFEKMANLATKAAIDGHKVKIHAPLIKMSKAQIIQTGIEHDIDYRTTISCYNANKNGQACGVCDACRLRARGFAAAGVTDATSYTTR